MATCLISANQDERKTTPKLAVSWSAAEWRSPVRVGVCVCVCVSVCVCIKQCCGMTLPGIMSLTDCVVVGRFGFRVAQKSFTFKNYLN